MKSTLRILTYDVEIAPGETLRMPAGAAASLEPGRWRITIQPLDASPTSEPLVRGHNAFLNAYGPDDEGLYDDCPPG